MRFEKLGRNLDLSNAIKWGIKMRFTFYLAAAAATLVVAAPAAAQSVASATAKAKGVVVQPLYARKGSRPRLRHGR